MARIVPAIIVMGVMGAGKTTLAEQLAVELSLPFIEGDDLHTPASRAKLAAGEPLTDADRAPWLTRIGEALRSGGVATCSALRHQYRDAIRASAGREVQFIFIDVPHAELERRLAARTGHFASPALLVSQLATLEPPSADERALRVGSDTSLTDVAAWVRP